MPFSDMSSLDQELQGKVAAIRQGLQVRRWRFHAGEAAGAQDPGFDDGAWPEAEIPITWSSGATQAWLRRSIMPATEIAGISLVGTPLEMEIVLPIGAQLHVDGRFS